MKKQIMENKGKLILSSLAVLLPGLLGWQMGWEALLFLLVHWACLLITFSDQRGRDQSKKAMGVFFWIVPAISVFVGLAAVLVQRGGTQGRTVVWPLVCFGLGLLFVVLGNYMPKFRPNRTMGIRIKWTLEDEENWRATHRFGGKVMVVCGLLCMAGSLLPNQQLSALVIPAAILLMVAAPCGYSYWYHKKQLRKGTAVPSRTRPDPRAAKVTAVSLVLIALFVVWALVFAGKMDVTCGADALTIDASGWRDYTVPYSGIETVEYLPADMAPEAGIRIFGVGNLRALMGIFSNDAYGDYTRYTHTSCGACIVVTTAGGETVVLNGPDEAATQALYAELSARCNAREG